MTEYFTESELERFMSSIETRRKKDIFQNLFHLGCRVGELCKLQIRWFDEDYVKVRDEKADDYRYCVIPDWLYEELEEWYFDNRKVKHPGPALFVYETPRTILRWTKEIGKRADIPKDKLKTHTFRGTFVRWAQSRGWNLKSICQQTGHTEKTMLEHYSELSIEDRRRQLHKRPLLEKPDYIGETGENRAKESQVRSEERSSVEADTLSNEEVR